MARRKNTKFIDPRYFMDEKMESLNENERGPLDPEDTEGYQAELDAKKDREWVEQTRLLVNDLKGLTADSDRDGAEIFSFIGYDTEAGIKLRRTLKPLLNVLENYLMSPEPKRLEEVELDEGFFSRFFGGGDKEDSPKTSTRFEPEPLPQSMKREIDERFTDMWNYGFERVGIPAKGKEGWKQASRILFRAGDMMAYGLGHMRRNINEFLQWAAIRLIGEPNVNDPRIQRLGQMIADVLQIIDAIGDAEINPGRSGRKSPFVNL